MSHTAWKKSVMAERKTGATSNRSSAQLERAGSNAADRLRALLDDSVTIRLTTPFANGRAPTKREHAALRAMGAFGKSIAPAMQSAPTSDVNLNAATLPQSFFATRRAPHIARSADGHGGPARQDRGYFFPRSSRKLFGADAFDQTQPVITPCPLPPPASHADPCGASEPRARSDTHSAWTAESRRRAAPSGWIVALSAAAAAFAIGVIGGAALVRAHSETPSHASLASQVSASFGSFGSFGSGAQRGGIGGSTASDSTVPAFDMMKARLP